MLSTFYKPKTQREWNTGTREHGELGLKLFAAPILFLLAITFNTNLLAQVTSGHSLFVCENNAIRSFGGNVNCNLGIGYANAFEDEPKVVIGGIDNAVSVSVGFAHSLALLDDGTVMAWGSNHQGAIGQPFPSVTEKCAPTEVLLTGCAVAISAGRYFSMALLADGTIWCWGQDNYGQLVNGTSGPTYSSTPVQAGSFGNATAISAGGYHALALLDDQTVLAWGRGNEGQIGNGSSTDQHSPQTVITSSGTLSDIEAIDAGGGHTIAIQDDGDVYTWGSNLSGQLGIGSIYPSFSSLALNSTYFSAGTAIDIAAGSGHSMVLLSNGATLASGSNGSWQFGITSPTNHQFTPISGATVSNAVDLVIPSTADHAWAIKSNGELWAWGNNHFGSVGIGSPLNKIAPPQLVNHSGSPNKCNAIPSKDNHPQPCCVAIRGDERIELEGTFNSGTALSYYSQNLAITGPITLTSGYHYLVDCDVVCLKQASITVNAGARLYIQSGSHLYACDEMWDGIDVKNGARIYFQSSSIIEDAKSAIDVEYGALYNINTAIFNRNYIHFSKYMPASGTPAHTGNYRIVKSKFLCQTTASIGSGTPVHENLLPPHQSEITAAQITALNVPKLLVGSSGSGNTFDNASFGVIANGVSRVEVLYNDFDDVSAWGTYVTNTPATTGTTIDINYNTYDRIFYPIYCYDNDTKVEAHITDNVIEFAGMGSPAPYGMRGITVQEIAQPAAGHFNQYDISDNTISNAPSGIWLQNLRSDHIGYTSTVYVGYNTITHNRQPNDPEAGAGIRLENVNQSAIVGNNITHPTGSRDWEDIAIRASSGNENAFYCDTLHHIGNELWFDGYQNSGTQVVTTIFDHTSTAFLLNWGDIGPQPQYSSTYPPHDNQWADPSWWSVGSNLYTTNVLGTNTHSTQFRVRSSPSSVYYPNANTADIGGYPVTVSVIGGSWPNGCVFVGPRFKTDGSEQETAAAELFVNVTHPAEAQSQREANQQWLGKYGLYDRLAGDEEMRTSATELENFFAEGAASNLGKLHDAVGAFSAARSGQETTAILHLQTVTPQNSVEQTLIDVLTVLYANATHLAALNDNGTAQLREIARRCPLDDGFGVYIARAALLKVDTFPRNYTNECELVQPVNSERNKLASANQDMEVRIYPNPSSGTVMVDIPLRENETATIEVFDLIGQNVFSQSWNRVGPQTIGLTELANGIYTVRLLVGNSIRHTEKLSIAK